MLLTSVSIVYYKTLCSNKILENLQKSYEIQQSIKIKRNLELELEVKQSLELSGRVITKQYKYI